MYRTACISDTRTPQKDLIEREVADTTYTKEIINNECLPLIGMRQTSFENLLETMDVCKHKHTHAHAHTHTHTHNSIVFIGDVEKLIAYR